MLIDGQIIAHTHNNWVEWCMIINFIEPFHFYHQETLDPLHREIFAIINFHGFHEYEVAKISSANKRQTLLHG